MQLSVMTFNIRKGLGLDERLDLERIVEIVRGAAPDVAALQEVDRHFGLRSGFRDQSWDLGRALEATTMFGPDFVLPPPDRERPAREYGNATLSRLDVLAWDHVPLPTWPGMESRGILRSRMAWREREFEVWNVHLAHEDGELRAEQARSIVRAYEACPLPVLLVGDINSEPGSPAHRILAGELVDQTEQLRPRHTGTFDSVSRTIWIDYVFSSPDFVLLDIDVLDVGLASDHLALIARVDWSEG